MSFYKFIKIETCLGLLFCFVYNKIKQKVKK